MWKYVFRCKPVFIRHHARVSRSISYTRSWQYHAADSQIIIGVERQQSFHARMSKSSRRSSLGSEASFVSGDDGQQDGNNSECQYVVSFFVLWELREWKGVAWHQLSMGSFFHRASQHSNSREENNHPAIPVTKSHAAFVSKLYK